MLRFTNVTKVYSRGGIALDDVSFGLRRGEFAFLTGSSGAGKSTILKLIHMEERPTHGEVLVGTTTSTRLKRGEVAQLRRRLGIVFQDFRLLDTRTAEQNVAFALEVTGVPRSAIPGKVSRALSQVGLASKATAFPSELSGGEQQRVAIARALVNDPDRARSWPHHQ
jgi:cell division transport system ATP-binding protein